MKQIITTLAVVLATIAISSCTSVSDLELVSAPAASASVKVDVTASIPATRATSSVIKSEWTSQDWIYVSNNGKDTYFKANESGIDASFSISGSSSDWTDGVAYAAYPKSVKLVNNVASFSFAGQTGLFEDLDKFNLMTSKTNVVSGSANFTFKSHVAVLAISKDVLYSGTKFSQIVVSGENFSSEIAVSVESGNFEISAVGGKELVVNNPTIQDGMVYVALYATSGDLDVDVYGTDGAHFFTTINASELVAGSVMSTEDANWDGGIEITFNPSVENWN